MIAPNEWPVQIYNGGNPVVDALGGALYDWNVQLYGRQVADIGQRVGRGLRRAYDQISDYIADDNPRPVTRPRREPEPSEPDAPEPRSLIVQSRSHSKMGYGSHRYIRGGRRVTRPDALRIALKIEEGQSVSGLNSVYVGGVTHPAQAVTGMVAQALVRFLFLRSGVDFANLDELICEGIECFYTLTYWWRQETRNPSALTEVQVFCDGTQTYSQFASSIVTSFMTVFGQNNTTLGPPERGDATKRLIYLSFGSRPTSGTINPVMTSNQFYRASELFISVKGESAIQVQNRTKADTGTDDNKEESSSIFANPLRGKYYKFSNGRPELKSPGTVTGVQKTVFSYTTRGGSIATQDQTGIGVSDYNSSVYFALKKPPSGNMFTNCRSTKYISASPGEIVRSKIEATVTKSLARWMVALRAKWTQTVTKDFTNLKVTEDPWDYKLGLSHIYGFEKMCDTAIENAATPVSVGLEQNLYVVSRLQWKPRAGAVDQVNVITGTV